MHISNGICMVLFYFLIPCFHLRKASHLSHLRTGIPGLRKVRAVEPVHPLQEQRR